MTENLQSKKTAVDDAVNGLASLYDKICNAEFQDKLKSQSFSDLTDLYDQYMNYLWHKNGKLSQFWVSYLDMVEILLGLLRASREGDWKLHFSCVRNMVPWCFAYDNINYAMYFDLSKCVCMCTKLQRKRINLELAVQRSYVTMVLYFFKLLRTNWNRRKP